MPCLNDGGGRETNLSWQDASVHLSCLLYMRLLSAVARKLTGKNPESIL